MVLMTIVGIVALAALVGIVGITAKCVTTMYNNSLEQGKR